MSCLCTAHAGTIYLLRGKLETHHTSLLKPNVLYVKLQACVVQMKLHSQSPLSYVQY
jgi:hypothetical protein